MSEKEKATSGTHRYVMCYSELEKANMVVYANSMEDASKKFNKGLYVYEK